MPAKNHSCTTCGTQERARFWPSMKSSCKECYTTYRRDLRRSKAAFINEMKETIGCRDCGLKDVGIVFDFDHKPEFVKEFNIAQRESADKTWDQLFSEMQKCDVVCSNCHRKRTMNRAREVV